jgi:hypothetical protein
MHSFKDFITNRVELGDLELDIRFKNTTNVINGITVIVRLWF